MHDVLVHYLEVNFPEIAEQLAHTHGREPTNEERAAAAERLRELIRRLRRGAEAGVPPQEPAVEAHPVEPVEPVEPIEPVEPPPVAREPLPVTSAPEAPPPVATAPPEPQAARLVPEQMAGPLQTILLAAAQQA